MVDFNINLAKSMTSSQEERQRFYHRMLLYLVVCAGLMVGVAYLSSRYFISALKDNQMRKQEVTSMASISEYGKTFFEDPEQALQELSNYASDLDMLQEALEHRSEFLPVLSQLFKDFPDGIELQSLSARTDEKLITFALVAPVIDEAGNDVLRQLQQEWQQNTELQALAQPVTQLTSEREWVGEGLVTHATYNCTLK